MSKNAKIAVHLGNSGCNVTSSRLDATVHHFPHWNHKFLRFQVSRAIMMGLSKDISKENCWFYTPRFPDARVDQNARTLVTNIAAELANDAHGCLSPKNLICQLLMVITIVISPCYDISYDTLFMYY